ncbi:MAG: glycine dehydrogenase subunit 2 [Candidatus Heimdallarchaeota archaeon]|nr:glycine dehydrogenase subunit 2 [Candidatus Heimdallarchaeota archaeon]
MYKQANWNKELIFEKSRSKRIGYQIEELTSEDRKRVEKARTNISKTILRESLPKIPELTELEVIRHFTRLSQMNYGVDSGFYPLGSCTMKYNPKICDEVASLPQIQHVHPYQHPSTVQGSLQIMYELAEWLAELSGMSKVTLQPAAGAHGEYTGIMIIREYHATKGNLDKKTEIIVPDSAHGTNPATASMCGFKIVVIPSHEDGCVDLNALRAAVSENTAGVMLTNPSTLGIFEQNIEEIISIIHAVDGLAYYDGANFNAIMGKVRPGDMGFDIVHYNLHKTFATPHGGGGPGSGPVGVVKHLESYLPVPTVGYNQEKNHYYFEYNHPNTIGKIRSYFGNFSVLVRAYAYILRLGNRGLAAVSEMAVLNANYMKKRSQDIKGFSVIYGKDKPCMHEYVLSARDLLRDTGISGLDVSKYLIDQGFHPPTIYFPLIVPEALMIEPTETEAKEVLDGFIEILEEVSDIAYSEEKSRILQAPINTSVKRIDDVKAARNPILSFKMLEEKE